MNYPTKEVAIKFARSSFPICSDMEVDNTLYFKTSHYGIECSELVFVEQKRGQSTINDDELTINIIFFNNGQCLLRRPNLGFELNVTGCWTEFNKNNVEQNEEINLLQK